MACRFCKSLFYSRNLLSLIAFFRFSSSCFLASACRRMVSSVTRFSY
jgi:hypothetical protein